MALGSGRARRAARAAPSYAFTADAHDRRRVLTARPCACRCHETLSATDRTRGIAALYECDDALRGWGYAPIYELHGDALWRAAQARADPTYRGVAVRFGECIHRRLLVSMLHEILHASLGDPARANHGIPFGLPYGVPDSVAPSAEEAFGAPFNFAEARAFVGVWVLGRAMLRPRAPARGGGPRVVHRNERGEPHRGREAGRRARPRDAAEALPRRGGGSPPRAAEDRSQRAVHLRERREVEGVLRRAWRGHGRGALSFDGALTLAREAGQRAPAIDVITPSAPPRAMGTSALTRGKQTLTTKEPTAIAIPSSPPSASLAVPSA